MSSDSGDTRRALYSSVGGLVMRTSVLAVVGVVTSLVFTGSVSASPIGYSGQLQAAAGGGGPQSLEFFTFGPVQTWDTTTVLNNTGVFGTTHVTARIRAAGGSIGALAAVFANEDLSAPDQGFQGSVVAGASMSVSFHDHWRVRSETMAPGTLVGFRGRLPSTWSSTIGRGSCGSGGSSQRIEYIETNDAGQQIPSFVSFELIRRTSIGGRTFAGLCEQHDFELFLPVDVTVPVDLFYFMNATAVSWNPDGEGNGPISGLGLTVNDLNTFELFFAPTGAGYALTTESGHSFAFPTSNPIPEPATLTLLAVGATLGVARRMRCLSGNRG
jgi:hypothetical protein